MKRSGILALWLILSLVSVVTSGCGYRVAATIQANAEATPVPTKLSWAAVPGPALSASAPETLSGLQTVSVPLATALSLYNWKWLSNPDQAAEADVLVRIWWMTDGRSTSRERADPFYRPGLSSVQDWFWFFPVAQGAVRVCTAGVLCARAKHSGHLFPRIGRGSLACRALPRPRWRHCFPPRSLRASPPSPRLRRSRTAILPRGRMRRRLRLKGKPSASPPMPPR